MTESPALSKSGSQASMTSSLPSRTNSPFAVPYSSSRAGGLSKAGGSYHSTSNANDSHALSATHLIAAAFMGLPGYKMMTPEERVTEREQEKEKEKEKEVKGTKKRKYTKKNKKGQAKDESQVEEEATAKKKRKKEDKRINPTKLLTSLTASNTKIVIGALNEALLATCDQGGAYAMAGADEEDGHQFITRPQRIISALLTLFFKFLSTTQAARAMLDPITPFLMDHDEFLKNAPAVAFAQPVDVNDAVEGHASKAAEDPEASNSKLAQAVLTILTNLSYTPANHRPMAQHTRLVEVLCLLSSDTSSTWRFHALAILANIAEHLDVEGTRRYIDDHVPASGDIFSVVASRGFASSRLGFIQDPVVIPKAMLLPHCGRHIQAVLRLISVIAYMVEKEGNRDALIFALRTFNAMAKCEENRFVFEHTPGTHLSMLVGLLFTPKNGTESLDYVDITKSTPYIRRVEPYLAYSSKEDLVDAEVRDHSLSCLSTLGAINPLLSSSIGSAPNALSLLLDIVMTKVGKEGAREDAIRLIQRIFEDKKMRPVFHENRRKMIVMASQDSFAETALMPILALL